MIDNLSMLLSLGAVLYVVINAFLLDKRLPWFRPVRDEDLPAQSGKKSPRQAGQPDWRTRAKPPQPAAQMKRPAPTIRGRRV